MLMSFGSRRVIVLADSSRLAGSSAPRGERCLGAVDASGSVVSYPTSSRSHVRRHGRVEGLFRDAIVITVIVLDGPSRRAASGRAS